MSASPKPGVLGIERGSRLLDVGEGRPASLQRGDPPAASPRGRRGAPPRSPRPSGRQRPRAARRLLDESALPGRLQPSQPLAQPGFRRAQRLAAFQSRREPIERAAEARAAWAPAPNRMTASAGAVPLVQLRGAARRPRRRGSLQHLRQRDTARAARPPPPGGACTPSSRVAMPLEGAARILSGEPGLHRAEPRLQRRRRGVTRLVRPRPSGRGARRAAPAASRANGFSPGVSSPAIRSRSASARKPSNPGLPSHHRHLQLQRRSRVSSPSASASFWA